MKQITNRFNRIYEINDDDIYWQKMMSKGIFQINNIRKLKELKPNARTIIDVGANIGTNTIEYGTWAKEVISFEPTPELYKQLKRNIDLNKTNNDKVRWDENTSMNLSANINVHQVAVGEKRKQVYIKTFSNNKGKNHVTTEESTDTVLVDVYPLDDFKLNDVDVIKIDVEGYELFVLQGAEQTIMKYRPVIQTELHQGLFKRQGITIQDVAEWFYQHDYYAIDKHGNKQPKILPTEHSGTDLFWIPNECVI